MAGNGFSGEQILTLTGERILLIWYRLRNKPLLKSIEWSSVSAELVGKHFSLFTNDELDALTADKPQFKDIVTNALKRHPQGVLFALYKSLLDTQGCGGAAQHASIAEEIQKETLATPGLLQPAITTDGTHPSAAVPGYPSNSQLASAERDRGLRVGQEDGTATTHLPTRQAWKVFTTGGRRDAVISQLGLGEDRRYARLPSLEFVTMRGVPFDIYKSYLEVSGGAAHHASIAEEIQKETTPAEGTREAPEYRQLEEWKDIVEFIPRCFENTHGDVLPAILREMGETASQLLHTSSELHIHREQSRALQGVVERCRMRWYEFAQFLLISKTTRPYISKIAKYTQLSITDAFKEALRKHLGDCWYQLATALGWSRTERDAIRDRTDVDLLWKINTFLEKQEFPLFQSERDTAEFLVKALETASLPNVADDVKRELAEKFHLEGLESTAQYMPSQDVLQDVFHGSQTSCNQGDAQPTSAPDPSHELEARTSRVEVISVNQNDDVFTVFAAFDGPMNEGEVLQTISNYNCEGVILAQQEDNKQLVHFAAEKGYTNVLKWLFEMGHEINAEMTNRQTPFLLACEAGHENTIRFLLTCDAQLVLTKDSLGRSCLHFPAILRNLELTYHLIWDMNADLDAQSSTGVTPVSVGCIMGDLPTVQNLVRAMTLKLFRSETLGGKLHKPSRLPPLHAAAFGGHQHIMEYLLDLVVNATEDHESIVKLIDVELRSQDLYTALHIAASRGYLEIVRMLVQRSANMVNAAARDATTPLLLAAANGHEDVVKYLLEHGADVDSAWEVKKGTFHLTPLAQAVLGRHVEVARVLLDEGADVRFKAGGSTSILALACIGGDEEIVEMVLHELEGDIKAFDKNELREIFEMPFVVSVNFEDFKCAKRLMDAMSGFIGDINDVIRQFSVKAKKQLEQYKEAISIFQIPDLPNQGDTCRRVAGSQTCPMYHLCYDDGPHWATELMQLCFMFETFSKPETFHTTYEKVYIEASKCILQTLVHAQDYTYESLASAALERGSEQAASFFSQYGVNELKDRVLFLEHIHSGNPSAMGLCCELVSAAHLQETYMSEMAGPVAQQYFLEMSRRALKHPGQFHMKFSTHGSRGTGLRLHKSFTEADCSRLYHKAIRDNPTITLHIAKAMTIGPPQVGKTSLFYHLLGLPPPDNVSSTPVMETARTVSVCPPDSEVGSSKAILYKDLSDSEDSSSSDDSEDDVGQRVVERCRYKAHMCVVAQNKWMLVNNDSGILSLLTFLQQKMDAFVTSIQRSAIIEVASELIMPYEINVLPSTHKEVYHETPIHAAGGIHDGDGGDASPIQPFDDASPIQPFDDASPIQPVGDASSIQAPVHQPDTIATMIKRMFRELQNPDIADVTLPDVHLLQFLDCGGQLAYHDILPIFVNIPAIYLHVFNVAKELTECPIDELCSTEGKKKYSAKSALSTADMITRSAMTVHSLADRKVQLPSEVKCESKSPKPCAVLVGTHLDDLVEEDSETKLKAVNELLHKTLQSKSHHLKKMVVPNHKSSLMFYPINNMLYVDQSHQLHKHNKCKHCRATKHLKRKLTKQAMEDAVKVEVPMRWYLRQLLELSQGAEKPLYSYSKLYQRCMEEGSVIDVGEFHAMVTYFHGLGLLVHLCGADVGHTEDSDCLVFTNPSFLFENISKLYQVQFEEEVEGVGKIMLKYEGKLSMEALRDLEVQLDPDHFMDLLVQLFIGAEVKSHEEGRILFVPSVLTNPPIDLTPSGIGIRPQEQSLCFAITFEAKHFIPCGVFPGMIARLQSTPGWEICTRSISRVQMKFAVGAVTTVILWDNATHINVQMDGHKGKKHRRHQTYRDTIIKATADSYCFLFHSKAAKVPHSGTCSECRDSPYLVLGQTCQKCPTQSGASEVPHFAELKVEDHFPVSIRCQTAVEPKLLGNSVLELDLFQNMSHYAVVKEQHTSYSLEGEGSREIPPPQPAERILQHFRSQFIKEVDANAIVFDLKNKDIISDGDTAFILGNRHPREQNQFLFARLEKVCTREALMTVCNVINDVPGNPRMKRLGKDMKSMLQGPSVGIPPTRAFSS